jgi:hypothetical protein
MAPRIHEINNANFHRCPVEYCNKRTHGERFCTKHINYLYIVVPPPPSDWELEYPLCLAASASTLAPCKKRKMPRMRTCRAHCDLPAQNPGVYTFPLSQIRINDNRMPPQGNVVVWDEPDATATATPVVDLTPPPPQQPEVVDGIQAKMRIMGNIEGYITTLSKLSSTILNTLRAVRQSSRDFYAITPQNAILLETMVGNEFCLADNLSIVYMGNLIEEFDTIKKKYLDFKKMVTLTNNQCAIVEKIENIISSQPTDEDIKCPDDDMCAVCITSFSELGKNNLVKLRACSHIYCKQCISGILFSFVLNDNSGNTLKDATCPQCRALIVVQSPPQRQYYDTGEPLRTLPPSLYALPPLILREPLFHDDTT